MEVHGPESGERWRVQGSYFEVCNCDAPCPCRRKGGRPGTGSQFPTCDFVLSWLIRDGHFGANDLCDLRVALAGRWDNEEAATPGRPAHAWHVILYVDERADENQRSALADIFLGRAGGATFQNYARAIGQVHAVKPARIEVDHTRGREWLRIGDSVRAAIARAFPVDEPITCGIPGHDKPGQEMMAYLMHVDDDPLRWTFTGRCGFSTEFDYQSEAGDAH